MNINFWAHHSLQRITIVAQFIKFVFVHSKIIKVIICIDDNTLFQQLSVAVIHRVRRLRFAPRNNRMAAFSLLIHYLYKTEHTTHGRAHSTMKMRLNGQKKCGFSHHFPYLLIFVIF